MKATVTVNAIGSSEIVSTVRLEFTIVAWQGGWAVGVGTPHHVRLLCGEARAVLVAAFTLFLGSVKRAEEARADEDD